MASTILKNLHNKAGTASGAGNSNGDIMSQFLSFKKQLETSGKDPQQLLNELLSSGKVNQAMYNKAKTLASVFVNKFKSGR